MALLRRGACVDNERKTQSRDDTTHLRAVHEWIQLGFNLDSAMKIVSASGGAETRLPEGHTTFVAVKLAYVRKRVSTALSDLEPNPEFITSVKDAMGSSSADERKEALEGVIDRWGQFMATSVELGCAIIASKEVQNVSTSKPPNNNRVELNVLGRPHPKTSPKTCIAGSEWRRWRGLTPST